MRRQLPPPPRGYSWPEAPRRLRSSVERARWDTEADMFRAFVGEARAHGFRTVPEACGHDLLLVAGSRAGAGVRRQWHTALDAEPGDVIALEGKLRPSLAVLRQALPPHRRARFGQDHSGKAGPAADFYAVLVPHWDEDFAEVAAGLDVGIIVMGAPTRRSWGGESPAEVLRWMIPHRARVVGHPPLPVPDLDVDMDAGQPSPRALTPWKVAAVKLCIAGRGRELVEADFASGPVRRRTFLDRDWMRLVRREGRAGVYALTDKETRPDLAYPEVAAAVLAREG